MQCIGRLKNGRLVAVAGYDDFTDTSCQVHVAGTDGWLDREMLRAMFHYPFEILNLRVVIGLVPEGNAAALRLNRHLGFDVDAIIKDAHPDGALVIMSMRKENCRWLKEAKRHGKKEQTCQTEGS
jgi:RimJ/RimL family protein N-acetyltransferase